MQAIFLFFLFSLQASAKMYYVKGTGGNGDGLSDATAWNFARLTAAKLNAGDRVLLKRGDVFFGPLPVQSGIAYGAYGQGVNPVISGLKPVSGWQRYASNIYWAPLEVPGSLSLVLLNGKPVGIGRYPNQGYLPYTGHTGNTAISGEAIATLPFNAVGGEVVIRKERWILDRHPVTAHRGATLTMLARSPDGGYNGRPGVDKNGFFLQNHLQTLDKEGEWWYDSAAKRLYMVKSDPAKQVRVSVVEKLVKLSSATAVSFSDLDFEGSSVHAVSLTGSSGISFTYCRFYNHGQTAIYGMHVARLSVTNCQIRDCLNNGVWVEWDGASTTVENTTVTNCGTIAGAGRSGDAAQEGISIAGDNTTIRGCTVTKTGYNAIHFNGNNARIENNTVDLFCLVKDDGAGIYAFESDGVITKNRVVQNNTVLHAVGAFAGAESYYYEAYGKAAGIYLDGATNHTDVTGNVIAHGSWAGFFVNNTADNRFTGNLVYGHAMSILLTESRAGNIRNLVIRGNRCIGEKALYIKLYEDDNPVALGEFGGNIYSKGKNIWIDRQYKNGGTKNLDLQQWKAFGQDKSSAVHD
jgi:parallel beta-helix repeat protein